MKYLKRYNVRFYKTTAWRKKRLEIIDNHNNECQICKERGLVTCGQQLAHRGQSLVVHHILHYEDRPDLALTDDNLMTVCPSCHNTLHPERGFDIKNKKNEIHEERWE